MACCILPKYWFRVLIRVTPGAVEAAAALLHALGCQGWECPAPDTVAGYIPDDARAQERITALRQQVSGLTQFGLDPGPAEVLVQRLPAQPWEEAWKAHFRPVRVGRLWITPTWEKVLPKPGEVLLRLDPGMAFGSGTHVTTQLCLRALQEELQPGGRVLDVGTGSGILAIAAALLGASAVLAIDNDPDVIPIALENAATNGVLACVRVEEGCIQAVQEGDWNVVVANIAPEPVLQAAPDVARLLAPKGVYIGAGIPVERAEAVCHGLICHGYHVERLLAEAEWAAVLARVAP